MVIRQHLHTTTSTNGDATFASRIRGAYALAIVDTRRECVFLAVDRFAIETLCYRSDGKTLAFSDRADCVHGRGDELDPQAIFDYLYFHMIPAPRTIFRQVRRLPAAHAVLIDRHGVHEIPATGRCFSTSNTASPSPPRATPSAT
jgi:asparagine synthase (glutamine-hydrolysing)